MCNTYDNSVKGIDQWENRWVEKSGTNW